MSKTERPRFVHRDMSFNPEVDLQEVDQFGFVNLRECYEKGIVPSSIELTDEDFNGVSSPGTLIPRSTDIFDGLRKRKYVESKLAQLSAEEREKVENALNRASQKENQVNINVSPEG